MLSTLSRQAAKPAFVPFDFANNPYKARKTWPPDFDNLSPRQQFQYERTYRRRAKLKWARPAWTKGTKIAQWTCIGGILFYGVFYMESGTHMSKEAEGAQPFQGARDWARQLADSIWSPGATRESREAIAQAQEFRRASEVEQRP